MLNVKCVMVSSDMSRQIITHFTFNIKHYFEVYFEISYPCALR